MDSLNELTDKLRDFSKEREWDQFHSPKNLVMALSAEVGELTECFQWLTESQSRSLDEKALAAVSDEIADVQLYLIRLADKLGVDIIKESNRKILSNSEKYPIEKSKGNAKKYTAL